MFSQIKTLFKKDIQETFNNLKLKKNGVLGFVLMAFFGLLLLATGAILYIEITKAYVFSNSPTALVMQSRKSELLTLTLALIMIFSIISGVKSIYNKFINNKDLEKISLLPISDKTIFTYKMIYIYLQQFLSCFVVLMPMGIIFGIICKMSFVFYLALVILSFIIPLLTMGIAAVLIIPYFYIKKFIYSRYVLLVLSYALIFGVLIWVYSLFLNALNNLLVSGSLSHFFNEHKYGIIGKIASLCFPANFLCNIMLGKNLLISVLIIVLLAALEVAVCMLFLAKCYTILGYANKERQFGKNMSKSFKQRGVFVSVLRKEVINVVRTPSFAISLFGVALTLPLLIMYSSKLLTSLVFNLVYININYQIAFFVVSMFVLLANTFCASNVSRDGESFKNMKALPINNYQILLPKIVLCFIVSAFTALASVVILMAIGLVTIPQGMVILFTTLCLSLAENFFATKYDFNHPLKSVNVKSEKETMSQSATVSTILIFLLDLILVGFVVVYSIFNILSSKPLSKWLIYFFPAILAVLLLGLCFVYFSYNLNGKKQKKNTSGVIYEK